MKGKNLKLDKMQDRSDDFREISRKTGQFNYYLL